ncbi:MAG: hypothetical protein IPJ78_08635 [Gemmatimonadetes bacterium]|jgi:hypothetical protein|nr:hypothetical protein [Gemmatimonadota bacterium]MBP7551069.1 hypothetical protein [Gemmatimonadaceae bacterium]
MPRRLRSGRHLLLAALLLGSLPAIVSGQGNCTVNNRATCTVGGTANYGMNLTVTTVVRLQIPSTVVPLGTATATEFAAGFGTPALTPLLIRANRSWTVTLRSTAGTWTGTGPQARPNKPVGELQWGTAAGGPFANMSTTAVTIGTGAATAGTTVNLYLRSVYQWTLDRPGAYSLPLQLTITAP